MRITTVCLAGLTASAALLTAPPASSQEASPALKLRGFAVNITGVGQGRSGDLVITVDEWSGAEERDRLRQTLASEGVAGLGPALAKGTPVGSIRTKRGGELSLAFASEGALPDGGRRIILATSAIGAPGGGSTALEYLLVEIRLGADGKGEGRTAGPDQLAWDAEAGALVLQGYSATPVWLTEVEVVTPQ